MGIFSLIWNWFVLVLIVAAAVFFAAGLWKLRRQPADDAGGRELRRLRIENRASAGRAVRLFSRQFAGRFFSGRRSRGRNGGESRANDKLSRRLSSPNAGRMGSLTCVFNKCVKDNKS